MTVSQDVVNLYALRLAFSPDATQSLMNGLLLKVCQLTDKCLVFVRGEHHCEETTASL